MNIQEFMIFFLNRGRAFRFLSIFVVNLKFIFLNLKYAKKIITFGLVLAGWAFAQPSNLCLGGGIGRPVCRQAGALIDILKCFGYMLFQV